MIKTKIFFNQHLEQIVWDTEKEKNMIKKNKEKEFKNTKKKEIQKKKVIEKFIKKLKKYSTNTKNDLRINKKPKGKEKKEKVRRKNPYKINYKKFGGKI